MNLILTKPQAEAVYNAMCALNNVGMLLDATQTGTWVFQNASGNIIISAYAKPTEQYYNQCEFALAYGIDID